VYVGDHLWPRGRQLNTNAPPLVEVSLMRLGDRHQLHFMNLSGHSETAYFEAIPMGPIRVEVAGAFRSARSVTTGKDLQVSRAGENAVFILPSLGQYELVELR